jgi:hypothetical protein
VTSGRNTFGAVKQAGGPTLCTRASLAVQGQVGEADDNRFYYPTSKKVKQSRYTPWRRLGGRGSIAPTHSFTTSALDGGEWSALRPGRALPPVPIVQRDGLAPDLVWTHEVRGKFPCLCRGSNLDRPVVQSIARTILTELPRLPILQAPLQNPTLGVLVAEGVTS